MRMTPVEWKSWCRIRGHCFDASKSFGRLRSMIVGGSTEIAVGLRLEKQH
jgi:hypothetical protein